eukprot:1182632-Prorocentrum_minimum.AAC.2
MSKLHPLPHANPASEGVSGRRQSATPSEAVPRVPLQQTATGSTLVSPHAVVFGSPEAGAIIDGLIVRLARARRRSGPPLQRRTVAPHRVQLVPVVQEGGDCGVVFVAGGSVALHSAFRQSPSEPPRSVEAKYKQIVSSDSPYAYE